MAVWKEAGGKLEKLAKVPLEIRQKPQKGRYYGKGRELEGGESRLKAVLNERK